VLQYEEGALISSDIPDEPGAEDSKESDRL
jgi:hypothetical protein